MSEVSVIGLGLMGSALARAFLGDGHRVTVWNRTSTKAEPLVRDGAVLAANVALAVSASPIVFVCVDNYELTKTLLGSKEVAANLPDRVVVQLSTGSPQEARDSEAWIQEQGAEYLDGAIMAFPDQIGTPDATILVAGSESAFQKSESLLKSLAGEVSYVGPQAGAASALDCAILSYFYGGMLGCIHGANICKSEGLPLDSYGSILSDLSPVLADQVKHIGEVIHAGTYKNPQASLKTHTSAIGRLVQQAQESNINSEYPLFTTGFFGKGLAAYPTEELASLIKVLREGAKHSPKEEDNTVLPSVEKVN
ncbi:MAG: NAD(P)-dependent oxidoreductase [Thiohalomonadales bacterium]